MSTTASSPSKRSTFFWLDHIEQWQQSGLSRVEYCKRANLELHKLRYWITKSQASAKPRPGPKPKPKKNFIAINASPRIAGKPCPPGDDFALQLPAGLRLQWTGQADPAYIAQLARELAQ